MISWIRKRYVFVDILLLLKGSLFYMILVRSRVVYGYIYMLFLFIIFFSLHSTSCTTFDEVVEIDAFPLLWIWFDRIKAYTQKRLSIVHMKIEILKEENYTCTSRYVWISMYFICPYWNNQDSYRSKAVAELIWLLHLKRCWERS